MHTLSVLLSVHLSLLLLSLSPAWAGQAVAVSDRQQLASSLRAIHVALLQSLHAFVVWWEPPLSVILSALALLPRCVAGPSSASLLPFLIRLSFVAPWRCPTLWVYIVLCSIAAELVMVGEP